MDELIQLVVKSYGIIGLLLLSPFVAVWVLWRQNLSLHKEANEAEVRHGAALAEANTKIIDAQKQRVDDAKQITDRMVMMIGEQSGLNKETNLALERLSDLMAMIQARQ